MPTHGYQPYKPGDYTQSVLRATKAILAEYEAWERPMTVRQVFYRLIAEYGFEKTENAYKNLVGYMARSRRAYQHRVIELITDGLSGPNAQATAIKDPLLIPFSWVRDERGVTHEVTSFDDVEDFTDSLQGWIDNLQKDRTEGQARAVELWCEAKGMVPLMREIAQPWGVRVSSGGGYDSVTAKHQLARRCAQRWNRERRPTVVLHVGDFDPSGEGMFETLEHDVGEMAWQSVGLGEPIQFVRVALTEDQVIARNAETAPPKAGDSRRNAFVERHPDACEHYGSEDITVQLEALTPPELVELIEGVIEEYTDEGALDRVKAAEDDLREEIRLRLGLGENGGA